MFKNLNASALGVSGHQSEIIELALTYGFRGIDLRIVEFAHRAKVHGMPYARRLIDSAQIRTGTFELPLDCDTDDDAFKKALEKLAQYAEVASEMKCTRCVATMAPAGDKRPYHENFEFHRRRFAEVCKVLEPFGVRLGVGFRAAEDLRKEQAFQFIHDLDALSLLVNMVGVPNIGVVLDVWDLHVSGAPAQSVRNFSAEQIVAVQLADLPEEDIPAAELTEASRLMPAATGRIDIPAFLISLAELGYDGPVTPKPSRKALGSNRRDSIVRQAGDALNRVWKAAGLTPDGKLAAPAQS